MKIKGVNDPVPNEISIPPAEEEEKRVQKGAESKKDEEEKKPQFDGSSSEIRLRNLQEDMKKVQSNISGNQIYLDNLTKASEALKENKEPRALYEEMAQISQKAQFNQRPLMDSILSREAQFYQSEENRQRLSEDLKGEIEKVRDSITDSQQQLKGYSISAENIKASLNNSEVLEMKEMFSDDLLYKKLNSDIVISLIQ